MKRWLLLLGLCATFTTAYADNPFRIRSMREMQSNDLIKVGNDWLKEPNRMQVTLRVDADTPAKSLFIRAYFYDKEGKEVDRALKPHPIWTDTPRGIQEVGVPTTLEKGEDINVYFALTPELEAKKWKSLIVVFGNETVVTARSTPPSAVATLDFPEKPKFKP